MSWARNRHEQQLVAELDHQPVTLTDVDDAELPGHDDWKKD
ncbi:MULTISPECIES: hypothetical protein [unclassified Microbacterium]